MADRHAKHSVHLRLIPRPALLEERHHARVDLNEGTRSRFLVVWLTSLPEVTGGKFQGDVREIVVRGKA